MFEISFIPTVLFLAKVLVLAAWAAFSSLMILWPVNDEPPSRGQWVFWWIWWIQLSLVASFIFGIIKFI